MRHHAERHRDKDGQHQRNRISESVGSMRCAIIFGDRQIGERSSARFPVHNVQTQLPNWTRMAGRAEALAYPLNVGGARLSLRSRGRSPGAM